MGIVKNRRTAGARMRLSLDRWAGCRWAAQTGGEGRGGELGCRGCPENPCNDGVVRGGHQGQKARGVSFFGFLETSLVQARSRGPCIRRQPWSPSGIWREGEKVHKVKNWGRQGRLCGNWVCRGGGLVAASASSAQGGFEWDFSTEPRGRVGRVDVGREGREEVRHQELVSTGKTKYIKVTGYKTTTVADINQHTTVGGIIKSNSPRTG